jgi:predicted nucleotidyltransferase
MDKSAALEILSRFRKALESQQFTVDKLVLFGSFATGTTIREGSDIDVVVISKDFAGKDFWQRTDILSQAIYEVFEPIEAVALTPEEWENGDSVVVEYAKNGEIVYG